MGNSSRNQEGVRHQRPANGRGPRCRQGTVQEVSEILLGWPQPISKLVLNRCHPAHLHPVSEHPSDCSPPGLCDMNDCMGVGASSWMTTCSSVVHVVIRNRESLPLPSTTYGESLATSTTIPVDLILPINPSRSLPTRSSTARSA